MKHLIPAILFFTFTYSRCASQNWLWAIDGTSNSNSKCRSVATDALGNIYATGTFSGTTLTLGPFTLNNPTGTDKTFIAKYDDLGNVIWAKCSSGPGSDFGASISTDENGNVYICGGHETSTIYFDSISLSTNSWGFSPFLTKYDANGNAVWARNIQGTENDAALTVCSDRRGNIYLGGFFTSTNLNIENLTFSKQCNDAYCADAFLAKYNTAGNLLWAKTITGNEDKWLTSISVDTSGNPVIAGSFISSDIMFDGISISNNGGWDGFVAKYNSNGNAIWAKRIGGPSVDYSTSLSADQSGNVYVTGYFASSEIYVDSLFLSSSAAYQTYLIKYNNNGDALWAKNSNGNSNQNSHVNASSDGNVFLSGYFAGSTITFDSINLTASPANCSVTTQPYCDDLFIVTFDGDGKIKCSTTLPAGGLQNSICSDVNGNVILGGNFDINPFIIGSDSLSSQTTNLFIAKYSCSGEVGIKEKEKENLIAIYPNPSSGKFNLTFREIQNYAIVCIYDVLGNCISKTTVANSLSTDFDLSNLTKGVYFLVVNFEHENKVIKIILE